MSETATPAAMREQIIELQSLIDHCWHGPCRRCKERQTVIAMLRAGADARERWEQLKAFAVKCGCCDMVDEMTRLERNTINLPAAARPFMPHARTCPAYGNYQPPYEECDCGASGGRR